MVSRRSRRGSTESYACLDVVRAELDKMFTFGLCDLMLRNHLLVMSRDIRAVFFLETLSLRKSAIGRL